MRLKWIAKWVLLILGLAYVVNFAVYLTAALLDDADLLDESRGLFLAAIFSFLSAIGFYYFTKFIKRMGKSINSLVDLERSLQYNYNALGVNIGGLERASTGYRNLHRYRFRPKKLINLREKHHGLINLDVAQTIIELNTEIVWLNEAFEDAPRWADDIFIDHIQHGMPNEAFRANLQNLADQIDEVVKTCRRHLDDTFESMCEVKAALDRERTLFTSIIKQRFSTSDRKRIDEIRKRVEKELNESRERSRQRMREYGIEPKESAKSE